MADAYEEHVERRARAMFPALYPEYFYGLNQTAYGWNQAHDHQKRKCREATRATMESDRAAGLALVNPSFPGGSLTKMAIAALAEHASMIVEGDADPGKPDWATCIQAAIDAGDILQLKGAKK